MGIEWHSQLMQDRFVVGALAGKRNGTFADIGAGMTVALSNTVVLEREFGWSGILCDLVYADALRAFRSPRCKVVRDAVEADWDEQFSRFHQNGWIDYLSLDLEPPDLTLKVLLRLPLCKYRFRIATVEHDLYRPGGERRAREMRKVMRSRGYDLVQTVGGTFGGNPQPLMIEDWWVHQDSGIERNEIESTLEHLYGKEATDGPHD